MKINENIKYRVVLGQAVLVDASGKFKGIAKLNAVAAAIWNGLLGGKSKDQIAEDITNEFDVSTEKAITDIDKFIEELKDKGFLED